MRILSYIFFACIILVACKGNNKSEISKEEMDALQAQEMVNQHRAMQSGEKIDIQAITDPLAVSKIKADILNKLQKRKEENLKKGETQIERYKKGDRTAIRPILKILSSTDRVARHEIYSALGYGFENMPIEPDLIQAIYAHLHDKEDQDQVIQVAGYNKFPGFVKKFEDMLFSGQVKDVDRLVYWLSDEGSSLKTFEYVRNQALGKLSDEELDGLLVNLMGFAKSKNKVIQNGTIDICTGIYDRKLIPAAKFDELNASYSSLNPAYFLLKIIFEYGDHRAIPIASDMLRKDIESISAMKALIRLEGAKHKSLLLKHLDNKDEFFDMIFAVPILYQHTKDESLAKELLIRYDKFGDYKNNHSEWMVRVLVDLHAEEYLKNSENVLKDPKLIAMLKENYLLASGNVRTFAADLYTMGVVDKKFDEAKLVRAENTVDEFSGSSAYLYNVLNISGIFILFDAETSMLPVDYDQIIMQLANNSGGKLDSILVWMDADMPKTVSIDNQEGSGEIHYKITLVANEKVYVAEPKDIGDWYDIQFLLDLMNKVAADAGLKERYYLVPTTDQMAQIIFGPEKAVLELVKKYKMGI